MTNRTTKINLDTLHDKVEADYIDGDIVVLDDIKAMPMEESIQMDMIMALMCTEGKLQVDINGKTYVVEAGDIIVCPPNVMLANYMISPVFHSRIIGFSYSALQRMLNVNKDIWNMILYLAKNPIIHLSPELMELTDAYCSLLAIKLNQKGVHFWKEVMHALFQAAFYDLCSILAPAVEADRKYEEAHMRQGDQIVQRFLKILGDSQGKERSVTAFAEQLCITPKYLTTVCKASTGKTALEWIHEYTTDVIVQQLKYSGLTIKEISDGLDFPNLSFFGKFVKGRLGMSPTEYRKRWAEEKK